MDVGVSLRSILSYCDELPEQRFVAGETPAQPVRAFYPLVRLLKTAPLNREMILNYIGEHVMGLPRSY